MQYIVIFSNILYLFYFCQSQYVQRRRLPCFLRILFSFPLSSEVHNHKIKRKICHLHLTYSSSLVFFPFLDSSKPPSFLYKTIASSVPETHRIIHAHAHTCIRFLSILHTCNTFSRLHYSLPSSRSLTSSIFLARRKASSERRTIAYECIRDTCDHLESMWEFKIRRIPWHTSPSTKSSASPPRSRRNCLCLPALCISV